MPVRGGRGRHSAPERKDVGHGKDDEEVAWNDVPNYQQTGNPSGAWGMALQRNDEVPCDDRVCRQ